MLTSEITMRAEESLKTFVDIKMKLHDERSQIEEASQKINDKLVELSSNVELLEKRNSQIETNLKAANDIVGSSNVLTTDHLASMIKLPDPMSEKIVAIVSKQNALEDCMAAIKKGFEKDAISMSDFLKQIRTLSVKQCKQVQKMQKIDKAMNQGSQFVGYQM